MPLPGEELPSTKLNKQNILELLVEPMCVRDIGDALGIHKETVRHCVSLLEEEKKVRRLATKQVHNGTSVTFFKAIPEHMRAAEVSLEEHYHPMARKVTEKDLEEKVRETQRLAANKKRSAWIGTTLGTMSY